MGAGRRKLPGLCILILQHVKQWSCYNRLLLGLRGRGAVPASTHSIDRSSSNTRLHDK